jgi:hypothetical protein
MRTLNDYFSDYQLKFTHYYYGIELSLKYILFTYNTYSKQLHISTIFGYLQVVNSYKTLDIVLSHFLVGYLSGIYPFQFGLQCVIGPRIMLLRLYKIHF